MSRLITWSQSLAVGIAAVDEHHAILIALLNELHEAVHRRRGAAASRDALERLRRFAITHFAVEEALMHDAGHDDYRADAEEQASLLGCIDEMLARIDAANSNITFHGLHQLKVHMLQHVRHAQQRGKPAGPLAEPADAVRVFGLTLKRA